MKILLVSHNFPPESYAGTEIYTYNLAKELIKNNHEVYIFYPGSNPSLKNYTLIEKKYKNIPVYIVNKIRSKFFHKKYYVDKKIEKIFSKILDLINPDIVHINHLLLLSFKLIDCTKNKKIPVILTLHDYWMLCPQCHLIKNDNTLCKNKSIKDCTKCLQGSSFKPNKNFIKKRDETAIKYLTKVDKIVAPSNFLINKFKEISKNKIQNIDLLRNGLRINNYSNNHTNLKKNTNKITLGFFGNITYSKGLHLLLKVFDKLNKNRYELKIYGKIENH